jgi:DNA-binding PadR family transcriptional regulator
MNLHPQTTQRPLNALALWVLIGLADEPCHVYGLQGRLYGLSLSSVRPSRDSLRATVATLLRAGLITEAGTSPGAASSHPRKLYTITNSGLAALRRHRLDLRLALQAINRAEILAQYRH